MKVNTGSWNAPAWVEVDPADVTVTYVRVGADGACEAYGTVLGHRDREFRLAYTNADGSWQVEGTVRREPPPGALLEAINLWIARARGMVL